MKCMYAQTRPRFILSPEGVFWGMEFEPMLTPREKSPLPKIEGIFPLELTWVQTPFPKKRIRLSQVLMDGWIFYSVISRGFPYFGCIQQDRLYDTSPSLSVNNNNNNNDIERRDPRFSQSALCAVGFLQSANPHGNRATRKLQVTQFSHIVTRDFCQS